MILGIDDPLWKVLSDVFIIMVAAIALVLLAFLIAWLCTRFERREDKDLERYFIKADPRQGYYVMERYPRIVHMANHVMDQRQIAFVDTIREGREIIRRLTSSIDILEKMEIQEEMNRIGQEKLQERQAKKRKKIQTYEEWTEEREGVRGWNWIQHRNNLSKYLEYLTKELRKEIHNEH